MLSITGSDIRDAAGRASRSKRFDSAGIIVMETKRDIRTATEIATAMSLNS